MLGGQYLEGGASQRDEGNLESLNGCGVLLSIRIGPRHSGDTSVMGGRTPVYTFGG
jgi:hypothetical protein